MKNSFEEIINFAIEQEEKAVKLYSDLQELVILQSSKEFLKELELMEQGHINILKNVTQEKLSDFIPEKIVNLKISDNMEEIIPNNEMTFQEILAIGMKREEKSYMLYSSLAEEIQDEQTKLLFLKLANEEAKHKLQLETIYDNEVYKEN